MSAFRPLAPRDPWAAEAGDSDYFGVFAFLAVIVVFGGVAAGLYLRGGSGYGGSFDLDNLLWKNRTSIRLTQSVPGQLGEPPAPLILKPGVAPISAPAVQAVVVAPAAPAAAAPTQVPKNDVYLPPVAAAMGIPGAPALAQPTATARPVATATAPAANNPPTGSKYKVVNTSGDGVYIRRTPNQVDRIVPWADNTLMEYQGEQTDADGMHWAKMKDPRGNVGWIPTQYLAAA